MGLPQLALARTGFAVLATLATVFAAPAAAQTALKVALDGSVTGPLAPFFVAQDRGTYRAEKLDVAIEAITSGPDALSRVEAGTADFTVADINAFLKFRDLKPGAPLKAVFMIYNKPPYAIIARKSRGIAKPKDLEGKQLGAPQSDLVTALWPLFAKLNSINLSQVKVENVAPAVREPMLAAGQVDAITGESLTTYIDVKERGVPVNDLAILPMNDYGLKLYGDAIIVNTKFAAQKPEAVKAFLSAYVKALRLTIDDPARAITSVTKRNENAKASVELERLRMAINENIVTDEVLENGIGTVDAARFAEAIDQLAQAFEFKAKPATEDVIDTSFLPPASQRTVSGRPDKAG